MALKKKALLGDQLAAAVELHKTGKLAGALALYDELVADGLELAELHNNRGIALAQLGRVKEALGSYRRAIELDPRNPDALVNEGIALGDLGCFGQASTRFEQALTIRPDHPLAQRNYAAARSAFSREAADRGQAAILNEQGLMEAADGRLAQAVALFERSIGIEADWHVPHGNLGIAFNTMREWQKALDCFDRALALAPSQLAICRARADALHGMKRHDDALQAYERAIALDPNDAPSHAGRAEAQTALGNLDEAVRSYAQACAIQPGYAPFAFGYARALYRIGDPKAALGWIDQVLDLDPHFAGAHNIRGSALMKLSRREEALDSYNMALRLNSEDAAALYARGEILQGVGDIEAAIADLEKAASLDPDLTFIHGQLLHLRMRLSDWTSFGDSLKRLSEGVADGSIHCSPFALLSLCDDPMLHRTAADNHIGRLNAIVAAPLPANARSSRIRIGYFSADFFDHATMYLIAEMLEAHDRSRFEITAFSYGPDTGDSWRLRAEGCCEHFIDVREMADQDIVELARSRSLDIAVDLKGLTGSNRYGVFARRAAPVQVSFLGYPGTMSSPCIDYLIADRTVIPAQARAAIAESIVYLPGSYQPNCRITGTSAKSAVRNEAGLPDDAFIFCCFNQNYKITPFVFDAWMRILKSVEQGVLWLWAQDETARDNLRREADLRGVGRDRILFASLIERERHLARLPLADLFLDTSPYGAHTTASDALRVGVPVLTLTGRSFASRVASSMLLVLDMPELVRATLDDYIETAVALAMSPEKIASIKNRLSANLATRNLFEPVQFARKFETALAVIYEHSLRGLPPQDVSID